MNNYAIKVEYLGFNYSGFQEQKNKLTIQSVLEENISKLLQENIKIIPSGRTDARVSAENQVCSFFTNKELNKYKFLKGINHFLPEDISIKDIVQVDINFNPRSDAKRKTYKYSILNSLYHSPLNKRCFQTNCKIDLNLMIEASKLLIGEHNFKAFQKVGSNVKTFQRKIYSIDIIKTNDFIDIYVTGNGFLYNMVRIIAGTLFEISIGKINKENIILALNSGDRKFLGKTLPADGLTLINVDYTEDQLKWQ